MRLIRWTLQVLAACLALMLGTPLAAAPVLSIEPTLPKVHAGQSLGVDVFVSGLRDPGAAPTVLGAFDLTLRFDASLFQFVSAGSGLGTGLGDPQDPTQVVAGIDTGVAGAVRLFEVSLLEGSAAGCGLCLGPYLEDLQSDRFRLAHLILAVLGDDVAPRFTDLRLLGSETVLGDAAGDPVPGVLIRNATIQIDEPGAGALVALALALMAVVSRRASRGRAAAGAVLVAAVAAGCGGGGGESAPPAGTVAAPSSVEVGTQQALAAPAAIVAPPPVPAIGVNITGSTYKFNAGSPPPDSMGAVGPAHFVEMINSRFAVYDKATGRVVKQSTLDAFWQSTLPAGSFLSNPYTVGFPVSAAFDPRVLYDSAEQRWYAVAHANMDLMVAVSDGPDPTAGWRGYQLDQHHTPDFELATTGTPLATYLADLNNESTTANPTRVLMQEFARHLTFTDAGAYLITQVLEAGRRWAVLCRYPHPGGFAAGCGQSRVVRLEGGRLRAYDWPALDFPTLGMDADNLYVATQLNLSTTPNEFFVIPKAALQGGVPPSLNGVRLVVDGPASGRTQPLVDHDRGPGSRALAVQATRADLSFLRIADLGCTTGANCDLAGQVNLTSYLDPFSAAQPGSKRQGAGTHPFVPDESPLTSNVVLINGEIHGVQAVCENAACQAGTAPVRLRYFRVRAIHDASTNTWQFTLLDDLLLPNTSGTGRINAFYGSVAANRAGQVVVGFTGSSATVPAGSYAVVGQLDAAGSHVVFGNPLLLKAGHDEYEVGAEAGQTPNWGRNRLGDYSATTLDPTDPTRFWTIQEWASALDIWSTQISEIRLAPPASTDPVLRVSASVSGAAAPATALAWNNVAIGDGFGDSNKGLAIPNGGFVITPDLRVAATAPRYPLYTAAGLPLGDGRNEATEGAFNFAEDAGYSRFAHFQPTRPSTPLQFATLELSIVAGADCANDTLTLEGLAPIEVRKIFPTLASTGCSAGRVFTGKVNLLNVAATGTGGNYTSDMILDAVAAKPWSLRFTYRSNAIVTSARLSLGVAGTVRSQVGDDDSFHGGDAADVAPRSPQLRNLVDFIAANPGQGAGADLDQAGSNRPVGLTHFIDIPADARITGARLRFRVKGNDALVHNDGLYYNDTVAASPLLPVIALRDLLGREPVAGEVLDLAVDLARVPVRTRDTTGGPGGHWSASPDAWRNLLAVLMRDRRLDLVYSDDLVVDFSELRVSYVLPTAPTGDLTGDGLIDLNDVNIVTAATNTPSYGADDPRDLDGDGRITVLDARKMALLCSRPRCAVN